MKIKVLVSFFIIGLFSSFKPNSTTEFDQAHIQVALLLDTSSSMSGLIEQAKSQLWTMVNDLASSKKNGKAPSIEISLYEYGKSSLSADQGFIRQIAPLTTDLDLISEKLFQLNTQGGSEWCGWAIKDATTDLEWSTSNSDLKLIIIAGNEPFNQGSVNYENSCKAAIGKGIQINTIFCGENQQGIRSFWKAGADLADGTYMNINHNEQVVHIPTPHDARILKLNDALNTTYEGYGKRGAELKERQVMQDANASTYGASSMATRAAFKSKSNYSNSSWDLVDAYKNDKNLFKKLKKDELPESFKELSVENRVKKVKQLLTERSSLQKEIAEIEKKRIAFITAEKVKMGETQTLDNVMINAVRKQAISKKFKF